MDKYRAKNDLTIVEVGKYELSLVLGRNASKTHPKTTHFFIPEKNASYGTTECYTYTRSRGKSLLSFVLSRFLSLFPAALGTTYRLYWKSAHPNGIFYADGFRYLADGSVCWMLLGCWFPQQGTHRQFRPYC